MGKHKSESLVGANHPWSAILPEGAARGLATYHSVAQTRIWSGFFLHSQVSRSHPAPREGKLTFLSAGRQRQPGTG